MMMYWWQIRTLDRNSTWGWPASNVSGSTSELELPLQGQKHLMVFDLSRTFFNARAQQVLQTSNHIIIHGSTLHGKTKSWKPYYFRLWWAWHLWMVTLLISSSRRAILSWSWVLLRRIGRRWTCRQAQDLPGGVQMWWGPRYLILGVWVIGCSVPGPLVLVESVPRAIARFAITSTLQVSAKHWHRETEALLAMSAWKTWQALLLPALLLPLLLVHHCILPAEKSLIKSLFSCISAS